MATTFMASTLVNAATVTTALNSTLLVSAPGSSHATELTFMGGKSVLNLGNGMVTPGPPQAVSSKC